MGGGSSCLPFARPSWPGLGFSAGRPLWAFLDVVRPPAKLCKPPPRSASAGPRGWAATRGPGLGQAWGCRPDGTVPFPAQRWRPEPREGPAAPRPQADTAGPGGRAQPGPSGCFCRPCWGRRGLASSGLGMPGSAQPQPARPRAGGLTSWTWSHSAAAWTSGPSWCPPCKMGPPSPQGPGEPAAHGVRPEPPRKGTLEAFHWGAPGWEGCLPLGCGLRL